MMMLEHVQKLLQLLERIAVALERQNQMPWTVPPGVQPIQITNSEQMNIPGMVWINNGAK